MNILRTPDERFDNLPDFNFPVHYITTEKLRMAYIDEGSGEVVLLLHGEPSWSFLYRIMIHDLVAAGYRVIAPDLIGFGRSDKPTDPEVYTYENHVRWILDFMDQLSLDQINLFCQDWGGLIGLRIVAFHAQRFRRVVASNTFLPSGEPAPPGAFFKWREFAKSTPHFDIGKVIQMASVTDLSEGIINAYNAPFPDESYKVGARVFPSIVPIEPNDPQAVINQKAWDKLKKFEKPFLTAFGDSDPITGGAEKIFQKLVPGCQGQLHQVLEGGGHFIQEDHGSDLASIIDEFIKNAR